MKSPVLLWTAILFVGLSGCWPSKKKVPPPPPAPAPLPIVAPAPEPKIEKPEDFTPPSITTPLSTPAITPPAPAVPAPAPPKPVRPRIVPQPPPSPAPPPVAPPPPPPEPQLAEILSDSRRRQYEGEYARRIASARSTVQRIPVGRLTAEQRESLDRIRTFIEQAESAKGGDLAKALQLARRASLLADDLFRSLR